MSIHNFIIIFNGNVQLNDELVGTFFTQEMGDHGLWIAWPITKYIYSRHSF